MSEKLDQELIQPPFALNVREALGKVELIDRHPGLELDKYHLPAHDKDGKSKNQKDVLDKVSKAAGDEHLLGELLDRRRAQLSAQVALTWEMKTAGPLTIHLARANTMENAGICLHPLYGFAYLPGSGLKGMARAYAETIWLKDQDDPDAAWRTIEEVFGWASNPLRKEQIEDDKHPARPVHDEEKNEITDSSGTIVFHDAWPVKWPELEVDVVTNHHMPYYTGKKLDQPFNAPGDWHGPNPVYFLALSPGARFSFALSKRHPGVGDDLLELARSWLRGALLHLGAGAKTAAGYGAFLPEEGKPVLLKSRARKTFSAVLHLVTPGFFAGADQFDPQGCDLRPATLRGLLRWWWRTMHAGFVDVATLARMEAALWGDTNATGAIALQVTPRPGNPEPERFDWQNIVQRHQLPKSRDRKTAQGLHYSSYGMNERSRPARYYLPPGAEWEIRLVAKEGEYRDGKKEKKTIIPVEVALEQAQAALWLLADFGGVGSKSRKGFGSLEMASLAGPVNDLLAGTASDPEEGLDHCLLIGKELRGRLGVGGEFNESWWHSPALASQDTMDYIENELPWKDVWKTLDRVGYVYQSFAKQYKHDDRKQALGLPRRIRVEHGRPREIRIPGEGKPINRHASPVFIHLLREEERYVARTTTFSAPHLPNPRESREFLEEFLEYMGKAL